MQTHRTIFNFRNALYNKFIEIEKKITESEFEDFINETGYEDLDQSIKDDYKIFFVANQGESNELDKEAFEEKLNHGIEVSRERYNWLKSNIKSIGLFSNDSQRIETEVLLNSACGGEDYENSWKEVLCLESEETFNRIEWVVLLKRRIQCQSDIGGDFLLDIPESDSEASISSSDSEYNEDSGNCSVM